MASVSVSHLVLFIASLVVAAGVAGTMTTGVERLGAAIDDQSVDASMEVRTDVEVISDAGSSVYNVSGSENVTLYVKNTGTRRLPPDGTGLDVIVDGSYVAAVDVVLLDDAWDVGDVVELQIDAGSLAAGDHRVKLTVGGDEEVFRFRT